MKIYIPNILPISLKDKFNKLTNNFGEPNKRINYEIISKDSGTIIIENQNIYNIESTFNTNYELIKNYNNHDLLVDRTHNTKIDLISQFPVNYIVSKIIQFEFKTNKKSKLSLLIDCIEETSTNFELEKIPINFYFNFDNDNFDLNEQFLQEEFNSFLNIII
jgi:hypothetical protein